MTMMGVYRVLLVCVFCTLWCGAAMATGLSSSGAHGTTFNETATKAKELGEKAAKAQTDFVTSASKLSSELTEALEKAKTAIPSKIDKATASFAAVKKAMTKAAELDAVAKKAKAAADAADKKTTEVVVEAPKLMAGPKDAADAKQNAEKLHLLADTAVVLWTEASANATLQLKAVEEALKDIKAAKKAADDDSKTNKASHADVSTALDALSNTLDTWEVDAKKLDSGEAAKKAIEEALNASKETAEEAKHLVNASTEAPSSAPGKSGKGSSPDGSPLTVSHLAATSVLLLLARVAAVTISA